MAHIGEEAEFHLVNFLVPLRFMLHLLYLEFITLTAQHCIASQYQYSYQQQSIKDIRPRSHPERRADDYLQTRFLRPRVSVAIDGFYFQHISTGRQIRVSDAVHIRRTRHPVFIKPFQLVQIFSLIGQNIIIRCKQHGKDILFIVELYLPDFIQ